MPKGCVFVFSHLGVIINGSFSTISLMISKEELPDPTMIPALKVVRPYFFEAKVFSTFFLDNKCLESFVSFVMPLK